MAIIVKLDTRFIHDWDSFHTTFATAFGFPDFYGRNLNAWIDCMSSLGYPEDGMTTIRVPPGSVVVIELEGVDSFAERCPEQYRAITECSAFVNWRLLEIGEPAVLAISFNKRP